MVETVKYICSKSAEEIISSADTIKLLNCYSVLYLNGGQPRWCARSQREYYTEIQKTGLIMAEKYEQAKVRTCKPAFKGLRLVAHPKNGHYHINAETLTDAQAMDLLRLDILKEDQFEKLPDAYLKEVCKIEPEEFYKAENEVKKRGRKKA
jgi:hypothetical protein